MTSRRGSVAGASRSSAVDAPGRDQQSAGRAEQPEHDAFGAELPDDLRT